MNANVSPRPVTGRMVLFLVVGFFALVMGVNGVMIKLAIDTLPGTETDSAYRASLAYKHEIVAARDQAARDWRVDARVERRADSVALVRVDARDHSGAPLAGVAFSGRLERPTDKRADREVAFSELSAGSFRGETDGIAAGQWDLVIEGHRAGERVFLSKNRLVLN